MRLEIVALERKIENIPFKIDENNEVIFYGFIDRIDILNGTLRIIDYKTAKPKNLKIKIKKTKLKIFSLMTNTNKRCNCACINIVFLKWMSLKIVN